MVTTASLRGRVALMVGHCAGMVDLVALPVWVGTLISFYRFDPQQAGLLATLFLGGAVGASLFLAPIFHLLVGRWVSAFGFGLAALGFAVASTTSSFGTLAVLHVVAGMAAGAALSVTHGTIASSANPHRLFAVVGIALGVFGIVFMAGTTHLVAVRGGATLFQIFAAVMAAGAVFALLGFPDKDRGTLVAQEKASALKLPRAVWWGAAGVACMGLVQSMLFSFLERVGADRGFSVQAVTAVLIALGFVNLLPAALAAWLEKRWSVRSVLLAGPLAQALIVLVIANGTTFAPYAAAASVFAAVMIFTHTFAFGALAQLDPSGRALSATPAMLMIGAALGPILGGTLVKHYGYESLGIAAIAIDAVAIYAFARIPRSSGQKNLIGATV